MPVKHQSLFLLSLTALSVSALISCLGITGDESSGSRKTAASSIRLVTLSAPTQEAGLARRGAGNTTERLESFQVAVAGITLVKTVELGGTGWHNPQGNFPIFENKSLSTRMQDSMFHDYNVPHDSDYIDFMTEAGRAKLAATAPFTEQEVGDYNFVLINWTEGFRVRASVDLGDGNTIYTKAGTYDSARYQTTAVTSMFTGPAETVMAVHPNGGTFFRFLKPLSIKESDLNSTLMVHDTVTHHDSAGHAVPFDTLVASGQLSVMLIFNPDGFITAWDSSRSTSSILGGMEQADFRGPDGLGNMHVPPLTATAVPYRQGQAIWRETYLFEAPYPGDDARSVRTRLELYFVEDNIVAINLHGLPGAGGGPPTDAPGAFFVENKSDGGLDVQNWDHSPIFSNFRRLAEIGATGTSDMDFMAATIPGATYTLVEKRVMNP